MLDWTWNSNRAFLQAIQIGSGELKAGDKPVMDWHISRVGKEILLKWSLTKMHVSTNLTDYIVLSLYADLRSSQLHYIVIVTQVHIIQTNNVIQQ